MEADRQQVPPRAAGQGLARRERVRRRPDFQRAYDRGRRIQSRFMTVFMMPNGFDQSRLGVAATRKLGSAVVRNRAKRLVREMFRRHKVTSGFDIVIVPRREMLDAPFTRVEADYLEALARRRPESEPPGPHGRRRGARLASRI